MVSSHSVNLSFTKIAFRLFIGVLFIAAAFTIVPQLTASLASAACDKDATCRQRHGNNPGDKRFCRNPGNNGECQACLNGNSSQCPANHTCQGGACIPNPTATPIPPTATRIPTTPSATPLPVPVSVKITAPTSGTKYPAGDQIVTITAVGTHPSGINYMTFVGNGHGCWNVTSTTSTFTCTGFKYVENEPIQIVATMFPKDGSTPVQSSSIEISRQSTVTPSPGYIESNRASFKLSCLATGTCNSNNDCSGSTPYCVTSSTTASASAKTCKECPTPGSTTGCTNGKVCSPNNTCVTEGSTEPTLTISASPTSINSGQSTTITWSSTNVTSCTASSQQSGAWTGAKGTSGTQTVGPLTYPETHILTLTCTGPNGSITKQAPVTVNGGPSITSEPSQTNLNFKVLLHGIGVSGDNVLPLPSQCARTASSSAVSESCRSNQNPVHPERDLKVDIFNQNNLLVKTVNVKMTYDPVLGGFKATAPLGNDWTSGIYDIQVSSPKYLSRYLTENFTINKDSQVSVPDVALVSSDVNRDDAVNILDWNMIVSCYTFPGEPSPCSPAQIAEADTNDDGVVDDFDMNLLSRELRNLSGSTNN